jgi:hypothetical protein
MVFGKAKEDIDFVVYYCTKRASGGIKQVAEIIRLPVPVSRLSQSSEFEDIMH